MTDIDPSAGFDLDTDLLSLAARRAAALLEEFAGFPTATLAASGSAVLDDPDTTGLLARAQTLWTRAMSVLIADITQLAHNLDDTAAATGQGDERARDIITDAAGHTPGTGLSTRTVTALDPTTITGAENGQVSL